MNYPLTIAFKILALAPQIFVRDANGSEIMYVKQKLFKLKEAINIFSDQSQSRQIYSIKADRIIDFSARYNFSNSQGMSLGAVKRRGMRSLWKASYDIFAGEQVIFHIQEENALIKVVDALFGEIPIVGMFSGYVFNPAYLVMRAGSAGQPGSTVMRLSKQPAFLETGFKVEKMDQTLNAKEEEQILLSLLMMTLLERSRG